MRVGTNSLNAVLGLNRFPCSSFPVFYIAHPFIRIPDDVIACINIPELCPFQLMKILGSRNLSKGFD